MMTTQAWNVVLVHLTVNILDHVMARLSAVSAGEAKPEACYD
jgi:hypothetical protein